MKYHLITLACLIAAIVCYVAGLGGGVAVFVAAGMFFELVFWVRLFKRPRHT